MTYKAIIAAAFVAALPLVPVHAQADSTSKTREIGKNATIAFASTDGIRDYSPDGNSALWIQDSGGKWYRAETLGPCRGLDIATGIGFVTSPSGTLDRFSQIRVEGRTCPLTSLVTSEAPPSKAKRAKLKNNKD